MLPSGKPPLLAARCRQGQALNESEGKQRRGGSPDVNSTEGEWGEEGSNLTIRASTWFNRFSVASTPYVASVTLGRAVTGTPKARGELQLRWDYLTYLTGPTPDLPGGAPARPFQGERAPIGRRRRRVCAT
ncbi:hypothetical protein MTO96_003991 [Rhipicephalus appendiculatus]